MTATWGIQLHAPYHQQHAEHAAEPRAATRPMCQLLHSPYAASTAVASPSKVGARKSSSHCADLADPACNQGNPPDDAMRVCRDQTCGHSRPIEENVGSVPRSAVGSNPADLRGINGSLCRRC